VFVTFEILHEMKRECVVAFFEESTNIWLAQHTLHRKKYLFELDGVRYRGESRR
jgi:hypothetical protein